MSGIRAGVRRLFRLRPRRPADAAAEGREELETLLDEQRRHLVACGRTPEEAQAEALRRLGAELPEALARVQRSAIDRERRLHVHEWIRDAIDDGRRALRAWRRAPAMAVTAVVTLALAIGANSAIYTAVRAVLLAPLPVAEPDRLVMLWEENPDFGWERAEAAPANMLDWRERSRTLAGVAAFPGFGSAATLTSQGEPRILTAREATGNLFQVLGVVPSLGRPFRDEETWSTGGGEVAILAHHLWRDVFAADSAIVGRTIRLNDRDVEVVGVLPERFALPGVDADVWRPIAWDPADRGHISFRRAHWLRVVARLRDETTLKAANAELQGIVGQLQREYPATNRRMGAGMTPLHEYLVGHTRLPLLVTFGGVALLFLIACANVANLLLVRAATLSRELAVRLALGAGRARLLRQALAEGALLAGGGGALGLLIGWWGAGALGALQPEGLLPTTELAMRWSTLAFAAAVTTSAALVFAAVPVWWSRRMNAADALREDGRGASAGRRTRRGGNLLLASQVALTLILTSGAGLLVRSYLLLQRVAPGFDSRNVLTARLSLPATRYDSTARVVAFFDRLVTEVRALPGVEHAALVSKLPLGPPSWSSQLAIEGRPPFEGAPQVIHREVTPGYHTVMRVPLLRGRMITDADDSRVAPVAVVNERFVRRFFPEGDVLGRRIAFDAVPDSTSVWRTIVGVLADERQNALATEPEPEIYAPLAQDSRRSMFVVLRTTGDPQLLAPVVRTVVRRLDPLLAISGLRTMDEVRAAALGRERFLAVLLLSFAALGFVLGLVGVYGVVAQVARQRTREMGIRLVLGAGRWEVQWLLVRHGVWVSAWGVAVGVVVSLAAAGLLRTLLYRVSPTDPVVFVVAPLLLLVTAAAAAWLPAMRASRTDPSAVLRRD